SLLTDVVGVAEGEMAVSFAVVGGNASAFQKVNRVGLRFTRPDGVSRDTVVVVSVTDDGSIRVPLRLEARERIDSLNIGASLREGPVPLFEGSADVEILPAEPTRVEVEIVPIAAGVAADRSELEFVARGESQQLTGYVLFATQDTISGFTPTWLSRDSTVISVTPDGLATGLTLGSTVLVYSYESSVDSIQARVFPPVSTIVVDPASITLAAGDTISLAAVSLSAQRDTLTGRTLTWASSDSLVALVSPAGRMIGRAAGTAQITVSADEATATVDVVVNEGGIVAWQLAGAGSWSDPTNWGGSLPGPSDTVVVAPDADVNITADVNVSIAAMTLGGGTGVVGLNATGVALAVPGGVSVESGATLSLSGASVGGPVTVGGQMDVTGGTVVVQGDLANASGASISVGDALGGTAGLEVQGATSNAGVLTLGTSSGGGGGLLLSGGPLTNLSGGVVSIPAGAGASQISGLVDNSGLVSIEGPFTLTSQGGDHANSGTFDILTGGSLSLSGADGFLNTGSVLATAGDAVFSLSGSGNGFASADGTLEIQGTQSVTMIGGPVDLGLPDLPAVAPQRVQGPTDPTDPDLAAYALSGTGLLSLRQLTMSSSLTVAAGASAEVVNSAVQGAVEVSGTLEVLGGTGNAFGSGAT
ncbi:MAG: Ig-like domain-containing protein, partial [Longimicrobiales bacterium]